MRIVVVAPSGKDLVEGIAGLEEFGEVVVLTRSAPRAASGARVVLVPPSRGAAAVSGLLRRTPPGRALRRLSPWDPGAMFAHDVRRSAAAREAVASADLLVATERDAFLTLWRRSRATGRSVTVVNGFPAARAAAERLSSG